jgi:aryl-alcohol dehydrogenase-like predicted oxidoreductase
MEYRQLGRSGLRVSTITLGTMGFGGTGFASMVGKIDVEGARKQIGLARDAGVNLIDTADVYSNGLAEEILGEALGIYERAGLSRFASQQIYYSLQARDAETELVPVSIDQGLGILVWSPLAGGLLSGKYGRGVTPPAGSRHLSEWDEPPVYDQDKLYDTIEVLVQIGSARGVSAAQIALAYIIGKPAVTSVIVGARTEAQLADNLASAELVLTEDEVSRLDAVSAQPLPYPFWHQAKTAADRLSPADLSLLGRYIR